jgi:alpha-1,6-mannosyltransferase
VKIVQLANFYTPTSGGLRTTVDALGLGYLAAGHERVLIVPDKIDRDEETPSGRRIRLSSRRLLGSGSYHLLSRRQVLPVLDQVRPDVLEVSDKLSVRWLARWARQHGVPLVLFSHERLDAILRSRVPRWFPLESAADRVNRLLSRLAEEVVVTSQFSAAEFVRVGATNLRRVPLGVDLDMFRPLDQPRTGSGVRLVMVNRLSREKCPERAIDALRLLRAKGVPAELTVIGDGPLRQRMQRRAAGLPVAFLGHVAQRSVVAQLVAEADVALSPSPAESFGLATLEALACGTPVVVPDAGAAGELITTPSSGVICDGTPAGLADAVLELLDTSPESRRSEARRAAERFPWSATVSALLDGYPRTRSLVRRP